MKQFLLVCLGGAVGSGARYLTGVAAVRLFGLGFPIGTLAVNLVGSFLISVVVALSIEPAIMSPTLRLFLTTGIMGGLTTYSAFNYEMIHFLEEHELGRAVAYMLITLVGCLVLGLLGLKCGRLLLSRSS